MLKTGRNGEKSSYLVVLLLFVGMTAFSNSMKELAEIHQWTLDAGRLIAQWSDTTAPAPIPPTVVKIEKLESCESKQLAAAVELPWLSEDKTEPSAVAPRRSQQLKTSKVPLPLNITWGDNQLAKLKNLRHFDINPEQFEIRVADDNDDSAEPIPAAATITTFRAKACKHNVIKLNTRDRDIFLKSLNRSINLRIAS